ncbi:MAG: hypothetical protein QOE61_2594 [Micromonosporaceae bacterium]|nr:hypothetical protein [Micromonosporaceae bacterium]
MASNRRVDRARIDRWEAALADYLTRQPGVRGSSMRAEDEPLIDTSGYVRAAARQEHNGGDDRCAVAVTVAQAELTASTYVVMPLIQFVALLRQATTPAEPTT